LCESTAFKTLLGQVFKSKALRIGRSRDVICQLPFAVLMAYLQQTIFVAFVQPLFETGDLILRTSASILLAA
jgi:hypothetical protein